MVKKTAQKRSKLKVKPLLANDFIKSLKKGKVYKMMVLKDEKKCTRQYCNYMLNKYLKTIVNEKGKVKVVNPQGCIHREGTRKWYTYTKV